MELGGKGNLAPFLFKRQSALADKKKEVVPLGRRLAQGEEWTQEKAEGELVWSLGQSTEGTRLEMAAKGASYGVN